LVHSNDLRYFLASHGTSFLGQFGTVGLNVGRVPADIADMEPTTGSGAVSGVVPATDLATAFGRVWFGLGIRVFRALARRLARSRSLVIEVGDPEGLEFMIVTEGEVAA